MPGHQAKLSPRLGSTLRLRAGVGRDLHEEGDGLLDGIFAFLEAHRLVVVDIVDRVGFSWGTIQR
jgi:hypothetical protein